MLFKTNFIQNQKWSKNCKMSVLEVKCCKFHYWNVVLFSFKKCVEILAFCLHLRQKLFWDLIFSQNGGNILFWVEIINVVRVALWFILPRGIDLVDESKSENLRNIRDNKRKDSSLSGHSSLNNGVVEKLFGSHLLEAYHIIHCCSWCFLSYFFQIILA